MVGWTLLGIVLGAVVGAAATHVVQAHGWRREEALAVRLRVTGTRPLVWEPRGYPALSNHLAEVRVRASGLGVDPRLIDEFEAAAMACFYGQEEWGPSEASGFAGSGGDEPLISIDKHLLAALDDAVKAIDAKLLRRGRLFGRFT